MKVLKLGSTGNDVKKWQYFLVGQKLYFGVVHGKYDEPTFEATKIFQRLYHLNPDGIVGNYTTGHAMLLGYGLLVDADNDITSDAFPPQAPFRTLVTNEERQNAFGVIKYIANPQPDNREAIKITNGWESENIIKINVPQLKPIKGSGTVYFHKKVANQLIKLFKDWEQHRLLHHVLTWEGSYLPRFVRGSNTTLSNHTFGTAFDINYAWNKLGAVPAFVGQKGSVRQLAEIANDNGFYWGGHFSRRDGMHFEIAKIL